MKKSPLFSLNNRDLSKALILTAIGAGLSSLGAILAGGVFPSSEHWKIIISTGVVAGLSQLIASWSANSKGEILKEDPKP